MKRINSSVDVVIIGGGFYGCMIALYMRKYFRHVTIIEKEKALMTKASYNNQARVHNGYHYPRNFITALRSHINYNKFIQDFPEAIDTSHTMIYGVARGTSKVTSAQFIKLCKQIGAPLRTVPRNLRSLFNLYLLEDLFIVDEVVFNAAKIREKLLNAIYQRKVDVLYDVSVETVAKGAKENIIVSCANGEQIRTKYVFNCSYANINTVLRNSHLSALPLKYEYAEMPLVKMPKELQDVGVTIMDGPFFSLMPFPDKRMHSFHHVRYTPHFSWMQPHTPFSARKEKSRFLYMYKDAQRYIPVLRGLKMKKSLYEIKTVLMQNESNDGRPILFRKDYGMKNFNVVMGGKIDNIYDIFNKLDAHSFL